MRGGCLLLALSGQSNRTRVCPLLDNSGHSRILARDALGLKVSESFLQRADEVIE